MSDLFKKFGGTVFDGSSELSNGDSLYVIDDNQRQLLAWLKAAMNAELNAKGWTNAVSGTRLDGKSPVEFTLNRKPEPQFLQQVSIDYPMLALWPNGSTVEDFTLSREQITTSWGLLYLLGPLNEQDYARLGAALRISDKLVSLVIRSRGHSDHDSGAVQLDVLQADFSSIRVVRSAYGNVEAMGTESGLTFYGAEFEIETTEVSGFVDGADPCFDGSDIALDHVSPEGDFEVGQIKL